MNIEIGFSGHNHFSWPYWPLEDPFIMHLQCKWKSTSILLCKNKSLSQWEFDAKKTVTLKDIYLIWLWILSSITSIVSALWRDLLMVSMNRRNDQMVMNSNTLMKHYNFILLFAFEDLMLHWIFFFY